MKVHIEFDRENDLFYLAIGNRALGSGSVAKTVRVSENIFVDLDQEERLLGIEVINASRIVEGDPSQIEADWLIGVKEAAALIGVSKSNFIRDHANRDDFPKPIAEIASGRIWLKNQVEVYTTRRRRRKDAGAPNVIQDST